MPVQAFQESEYLFRVLRVETLPVAMYKLSDMHVVGFMSSEG